MYLFKYYKNFILDMDGTIIDSENIHYEAYKQAFQYYGLKEYLSFNQHIILAHSNDYMLREYILNILSPKIEWQLIYNKKTEYLIERLKTEDIKLMPYIKKFINTCQKFDKNIVIVTNSTQKIVDIFKLKFNILQKIDKWVTYDDVFYKKPHPQPYLKAYININ